MDLPTYCYTGEPRVKRPRRRTKRVMVPSPDHRRWVDAIKSDRPPRHLGGLVNA